MRLTPMLLPKIFAGWGCTIDRLNTRVWKVIGTEALQTILLSLPNVDGQTFRSPHVLEKL